jgi:hypothetical protein
MPVDFVGYTADRRISGAIPLADDRLSDMLNSVSRLVVRRATVDDLVNGGEPYVNDETIAVGELVVVVAGGRRGSESRRRRTELCKVRMGLGRFVVTGMLHVSASSEPLPISGDPDVVLAGRDLLVALTDATVTYDRATTPDSEHHDAVLVNRALATWIDVGDDLDGDEPAMTDSRPRYHAAMVKDFTGSY